jgi:RNA polymerase sigma-70 factor (ECF subfamily)
MPNDAGTEENPQPIRLVPAKDAQPVETPKVQFGDELVALLPRLRRFARVVTRNRTDADDLVQMAVERALRHSRRWSPGTRLDSWVFRIMKNAWIDEFRARRRRHDLFAPAEAGDAVGRSSATVDSLSVERAMATLNDDQRMVVGLVLIEGLSYKEAANALDIPVGTLTSRLARAREALQAMLGDSAGELE